MRETAYFGGGCFWCTEALLETVPGVVDVISGYAGGTVPNPSYTAVCTGLTGHAEVVEVTFDPEVISYQELVEIFFEIHNPTTRNRQGADIGPQYRSIILTTSAEQKNTAEKVKAAIDASEKFDKPVVTEIKPLITFYPAEEHHQDYFSKNPEKAYCRMVISPKLDTFRKKHPESRP
ncbi:peptide-methionine (S)-S-oxide reductase MsrA [Candidatus Woesebacteria bacterium]|nr:peptide-methionine (S)-S-oxide reductase MsrA [Candidatus Woesebacteria bacterium]MCD8527035.1 peptide-methionine (S)-S-oxide reductase MsrA [Candidatus Woesebacteria bacterium]MCD8545903.1 peptide-methionine (S)-S-oxide reductase MsrA [Candidatus Woesebacteria bacterium]